MSPSDAAASERKGLSPLAWVLIVIIGLIVIMGGACTACVGLAAWWAADQLEEVATDFEQNPARAAAEMAVRLNPGLELLETDDDAGTMTIRNSVTGEEASFDFSEIAAGRLSFAGADGEMTVDTGAGTVVATTPEGEVSVSAGEDGLVATMPDGELLEAGMVDASALPDWVLRYPEAVLASEGVVGISGDTSGGAFLMTTGDEAEVVFSWYEEAMQQAGFRVTRQGSTSGGFGGASGILIGQTASPERTLNVIVNETESGTEINTQYAGATR